MRKFSLLPVFLISVFSFAHAQAVNATETLKLFQPADNIFSVAFPAQPATHEDSFPSTTGSPYKRISYVYESSFNMLMVTVIYVGRDFANSDAEQATLLESVVSSMTKSMPGLLLNKSNGISEISIAGHRGKQIKGTANDAGFYARLYATPRYMFMVQGVSEPGNKWGKSSAEKFVNSFNITE